MNQVPDRSRFKMSDFGVMQKTRPASSAEKVVVVAKTPPRKRRLRAPRWVSKFRLLVGLAVFLTIVTGALLIIVNKQRQEITQLKSSQTAVDDETTQLIRRVAALVSLPEGEAPTIATVTDVEKLKTQTFFAKAENGDRVLIFSKARKAYLYRPSTNKIIEIGPINIGSSGAGTTTTSPS